MYKSGVLLTYLALSLANSAYAQPKIGAIGDSLLDEHFDQSGFGTALGYSKNGLELMVASGQFDAGPLGNWGGTRGTGFQYNWALAGSTTDSLLAGNQHTNLANQVAVAGITKAVLIIGSNNLFPYAPTLSTTGFPGSNYETLYEGLASPAEVTAIATQAVSELVLAAQTLKNSGVDLVVGTTPDYGIAPLTKILYPDPVKRERVDDVLESWTRDSIEQLTTAVRVPVVDMYLLTKDIWGDHGSENETFELGGVDLDLDGTGGVDYATVLNQSYDPSQVTSDTPDAYVHDGIHPNSTIGGIFANLFLTAFNQEYEDSFTLFTEHEILANAGPSLGGLYTADTLVSSLGGKNYADYVIPAISDSGDFNSDGSVDGADFLAWQRGESPIALSAADLTEWQSNYGDNNLLSATSTVIPEPSTLLLLVLPTVALSTRRWWRSLA